MPQSIATRVDHEINVDMISSSLSSKGYMVMSLILRYTLQTLVPHDQLANHSTVTIFCPHDNALYYYKTGDPSLGLLQYHVVPFKIDREVLDMSMPYVSKIDTLLSGHSLVPTTLPGGGPTSINGVKVKEWDVYIDGRVIIHGVDDFFDPAV
ncbi:putative fasciclin-like arabinogalactan protein 20 [Cornus florida]|uniref:putative fasciclin-like arabinogalactan protein 20 n=1 Tax=Cornus florida TaxID=4283 RepID=UPI00289BFEF2|nr:putative fasciclin-like arabinogalactan protein 20 [Cornus florida]